MDHKTWRETRRTAVSRANTHLNDVQQAHLATLIRIGEEIDRDNLAAQLAYAEFLVRFGHTTEGVVTATSLPYLTTLLDIANYFARQPSALNSDVIRAIRSTSRVLMHLGENWEKS